MEPYNYLEAFNLLPCISPNGHSTKFNGGDVSCLSCNKRLFSIETQYDILEKKKENANMRLEEGIWKPYTYRRQP